MKSLIQIGIGFFLAGVSLVLLYFLAISELNFQDPTFGLYLGIFAMLAGIGFFVLTRNDDNEETNPGKEKVKR